MQCGMSQIDSARPDSRVRASARPMNLHENRTVTPSSASTSRTVSAVESDSSVTGRPGPGLPDDHEISIPTAGSGPYMPDEMKELHAAREMRRRTGSGFPSRRTWARRWRAKENRERTLQRKCGDARSEAARATPSSSNSGPSRSNAPADPARTSRQSTLLLAANGRGDPRGDLECSRRSQPRWRRTELPAWRFSFIRSRTSRPSI